MKRIAIVGNGPRKLIPDLRQYASFTDTWIGADRGALTVIENGISPAFAVGDFDSINEREKEVVRSNADSFTTYPSEKDQTDLEIALDKAISMDPQEIYLFGVTGGRLDHAMTNIQLLYLLLKKNVKGIIIDTQNRMELTEPGSHEVSRSETFPYISFVPLSKNVEGLTLQGFYYPLNDQSIMWGSTLCISNKLISNYGTFSYREGILLLIKSRDAVSHTIPV
ncbi:thiamine diphosphokinase [Virgibacillus kekensis]|uniref:Thiamine diphosphokinase n=1 Tax=Virgibacillus kekensis TaxID=202261 RepID=A0ABV9DGT0_9BACI